MKKIHVLPINDIKAHHERGATCICIPKVEVTQDGYIVTHNSFDGREQQEEEHIRKVN